MRNKHNCVIAAVTTAAPPRQNALHCPHFSCSPRFCALHFARSEKVLSWLWLFMSRAVQDAPGQARRRRDRPAGLPLTATILARPLPPGLWTGQPLSNCLRLSGRGRGRRNNPPSGVASLQGHYHPWSVICRHPVADSHIWLLPVGYPRPVRRPNKQLHFDLLA